MTNNILDKIIASKKIEIEKNKSALPMSLIMETSGRKKAVNSLKNSLLADRSTPAIIAEFKRGSPSKGIINNSVDSSEVISGYIKAGAAGVSILTDQEFFYGSLKDLPAIEGNTTPFLRKDFIVDEYQIHEARYYGFDAILLIAAALTSRQIAEFIGIAHSINLEVLLEVHDLAEIEEKASGGADIIGVNNRNLKNFTVDIKTSLDLIKHLPNGVAAISESGINSKSEMEILSAAGYDGFLIGEKFMKEADPAAALRNFLI